MANANKTATDYAAMARYFRNLEKTGAPMEPGDELLLAGNGGEERTVESASGARSRAVGAQTAQSAISNKPMIGKTVEDLG